MKVTCAIRIKIAALALGIGASTVVMAESQIIRTVSIPIKTI